MKTLIKPNFKENTIPIYQSDNLEGIYLFNDLTNKTMKNTKILKYKTEAMLEIKQALNGVKKYEF